MQSVPAANTPIPAAQAEVMRPTDARPTRLWPAILLLFVLAPVTAEVLSGSTPLLVLVTNPILFAINFPFYGGGALLVREVVRRRRLGWASVLWLGAAYGIFEEGVVLNTWADPWAQAVCTVAHGAASGICDYSRVAGINLLWAVGVTTYHAVVSITIPILLVEMVFPRQAARPWLKRKDFALCLIGEALVLAFGLALNVADFHKHGQQGPLPLPYLIEVALMAGCVALALTRRRPGEAAAPRSTRRVPRLWLLRVLGLLSWAVVILSSSLYMGTHLPFGFGLAIDGALLGLASWRVTTWAWRAGWTDRQMLALASGVLGFFIFFWSPLLELLGTAGGNPTHGTALVGLAYLLFLNVLTRRKGPAPAPGVRFG